MKKIQKLHERKKKECCCRWKLKNDINDTWTGTKWKCTKWCNPPCPDSAMKSPPKEKDVHYISGGSVAVVKGSSKKIKESIIRELNKL